MMLYRRSPSKHKDNGISASQEKARNGSIDHVIASEEAMATVSSKLLDRWRFYMLVIFLPLGVVAGVLQWNPSAVFMLNLLAIVPLAASLSVVTEDLASNAGQTIGALLNATFGNAPELIVSDVQYLIDI